MNTVKARGHQRSSGFSKFVAGFLMVFLMAGCATPGTQRYLGDSANDDAITGHRYLGPIDARDIGRIDLERLRPTTYRFIESGEVAGEQVVKRWKVGATIRETRALVFDEVTLTLLMNRGVAGRIYGIELESVKMASGELASEDTLREAQLAATALVGPLFAYEQAVLGKPLVVGERYTWDVSEALGAFLENMDDHAMEGIDLSAEGASVYLGVTQTAQGEAAVFREYARMAVEMDGMSQAMQGAGWRLIDRRTGALIERDMRMKVTYAMDGDFYSTYEGERVELADD
ncbi:UNVERIFIED_CONTAM: hypothetical protein K0B97_03175 [Spiribacter pallidus]